jgi:protein-tyrosine-phosphatase
MFQSILVVCTGNICRSPIGERLLRQQLPGKQVTSAGILGLEGIRRMRLRRLWPGVMAFRWRGMLPG